MEVARKKWGSFLSNLTGAYFRGTPRPVRGLGGRRPPLKERIGALSYLPAFLVLTTGSTSLIERADEIFKTPGSQPRGKEQEALQAKLYEEIGRLKVELEWLKKKAAQFE